MHTNKVKSSDARHAYLSLLIITTVICHLLFHHYSKSQVLSQHRTKKVRAADHSKSWPLVYISTLPMESRNYNPKPNPIQKENKKMKQKTKERDIHCHQIVSLQVPSLPFVTTLCFFLLLLKMYFHSWLVGQQWYFLISWRQRFHNNSHNPNRNSRVVKKNKQIVLQSQRFFLIFACWFPGVTSVFILLCSRSGRRQATPLHHSPLNSEQSFNQLFNWPINQSSQSMPTLYFWQCE